MIREWQNLEIATYPQHGWPNEEHTRSGTEIFLIPPKMQNEEQSGKFLVFALKTSNELGTPLEIPVSYPPTMHNVELSGNLTQVSQILQNCPRPCKVIRGRTPPTSSKILEMRNGLDWYLKVPRIPLWLSGMYTYQFESEGGKCKKLDLQIPNIMWNRRNLSLAKWSM